VIIRKFPLAVLGALLAAVAAPGFAQEQFASAASQRDLLRSVEDVAAGDIAARERNRAAYTAASPEERTRMLREAQARRDELQMQSDELQTQFDTNDIEVFEVRGQLDDKATLLQLAELFGVARQVAQDTAQVLQQSLISTQIETPPGELRRDEFLRQFASSGDTPTIDELQRLWFEMHREMTMTGQVARYQTGVVQPSGQSQTAEVIRIGPFNATTDGLFLGYRPTIQRLTVLPRQLPEEFHVILERFENATEGYAQAVVDSNRGVLLALYVERPTLEVRIELGEEVGYVSLSVGALGILAFLFQLVYLIAVRIAVRGQLKDLDHPKPNNPLGRVLLAFKGDAANIEQDADVAELRISEAVLGEVPKLERFQAFLRLCVAAGPLLGLIGTVVGMIITFQSITESGSSDPRLMATGIGQAMIATVLGLGIAIPLLFANALLNSLSRGLVQVLDEQSAGMLATSIEKQRHARA
jgi:biopolymer transport protein ExbB